MRVFLVIMIGVVGGCEILEAPVRCSADGDCPLHQFCAPDELCRSGCLSSATCEAGLVCDTHGRCVTPDSGGLDGMVVDVDLSVEPDLPKVPDLSMPKDGDGLVPASCGDLKGALGSVRDPSNGHCYVTFAGPMMWAEALSACQARGATLATVTSAAEDALVRKAAMGAPRWIGLSSHAPGGKKWVWANGEKRTFNGWAPGEPSNKNNAEDCVLMDPERGWDDETCGWPTSGVLDPSADTVHGYICEHACGNNVVEDGEECDPPGPTCTSLCRTKRPCTEPGGVVGLNGHCYFQVEPATGFDTALTGCPAGTHLATLRDPTENAAALQAMSAESWIALKATAAAKRFEWQVGDKDFNHRRFHGFNGDEPNGTSVPTCVRLSTTRWRDSGCATPYPRMCERE